MTCNWELQPRAPSFAIPAQLFSPEFVGRFSPQVAYQSVMFQLGVNAANVLQSPEREQLSSSPAGAQPVGRRAEELRAKLC